MDQEMLKGKFNFQRLNCQEPKVLTVAVKLPTGAIEVITNTTHIEDKINYYMKAYDDGFRLRNNPEIQIVGFMLV